MFPSFVVAHPVALAHCGRNACIAELPLRGAPRAADSAVARAQPGASRRRFAARIGEDRSADRAGMDGVTSYQALHWSVADIGDNRRDDFTLANSPRGDKRFARRTMTFFTINQYVVN